uniref:Uncharacterized protein n=1 Tax=Rhizophora mucronata TaxID=61149 RepID=A0A2P2NEQ5_RHIMU
MVNHFRIGAYFPSLITFMTLNSKYCISLIDNLMLH